MSATPLYLLSTQNDASANPVHILTNGKMNVASNSSQIIDGSGVALSYSLNVGSSTNLTNMNTYGTYFSNAVSAIKIPADISANRPPGETGYIRLNTTVNLLEYWNPATSSWSLISTPPILLSTFPTTVLQPTDLSLNGFNFQNGATVKFTDVSGVVYNSPSVTYLSSTLLVANSGTLPFTGASDFYDVTVTNPGGLESTLQNYISTGIGPPVFTTAAGNIGRIYTGAYYDSGGTLTSYYTLLPVTATDPDGQSITGYSITSGSLPPGLSLNASTGDITGNIPLGSLSAPTASPSSTTYTFTVKADTDNASSSRSFNIVVYQPYLYTSSFTGGPDTFNVPASLTTTIRRISARLWGSGGGSYNDGTPNAGCGAPGGFTKTIFNVLSGENVYTLVVGGGGNANSVGGYGGGGGGANGGSGAGGGSYIFSGSIATPFQSVSPGGYISNEPTASVTGLSGASGIIAVAGGGGGAGWFITNNMNGGTGGGITAGNSFNGNSAPFPTGGSQSAGGAGNPNGTSVSGSGLLKGSGVNNNGSSGGSGGGGGGWYGGGAAQGGTGVNWAGGGGSGFAGYQNGSTSTVLTGTNITIGSITYPSSYQDTTTRTNGTRTYTNTQILRSPDLGSGQITSQQLPPLTTDSYWSSSIGVSGPRGNPTPGANGGNGYIVLIY